MDTIKAENTKRVKRVKVQGRITPFQRAKMEQGMEAIGINSESAYVAMAIKKLNDEIAK